MPYTNVGNQVVDDEQRIICQCSREGDAVVIAQALNAWDIALGVAEIQRLSVALKQIVQEAVSANPS